MKETTLKRLTPLLSFLRSYEVLEEAGESRFLLRGRDFIHFHDDPDGLWADAKLSRGRIRISVASASEQGELMEIIARKLETLESHSEPDQNRRGRRKVKDTWRPC
jgi:hypothetical protein